MSMSLRAAFPCEIRFSPWQTFTTDTCSLNKESVASITRTFDCTLWQTSYNLPHSLPRAWKRRSTVHQQLTVTACIHHSPSIATFFSPSPIRNSQFAIHHSLFTPHSFILSILLPASCILYRLHFRWQVSERNVYCYCLTGDIFITLAIVHMFKTYCHLNNAPSWWQVQIRERGGRERELSLQTHQPAFFAPRLKFIRRHLSWINAWQG